MNREISDAEREGTAIVLDTFGSETGRQIRMVSDEASRWAQSHVQPSRSQPNLRAGCAGLALLSCPTVVADVT